jgi:hypothetical protein
MRPALKILLGTRPLLDLNFLSGATPGGFTLAGGANGTRVSAAGSIIAATCPRFSHSPVSLASRGLLIEEAREELAIHSDALTNAAYDAVTYPVTVTAATASRTGLPLFNIAGTAANARHFAVQNIGGGQAGETYSITAIARAADTNFLLLGDAGDATWRAASFDLSSGTVRAANTGVAGVLESLGGGEYRCTVTYTRSNVGGINVLIGVDDPAGTLVSGGGMNSFVATGCSVDAGAVNASVGAFPTSHIPATAAAVTRTADSATYAWTQADGTYAVEFDLNAVTGTRPILSLDDGTADNQIRLYASGTDLKLSVTVGGVSRDLTLGTVAANTTYKAAFSVFANDVQALMNGGTLQSNITAGAVPAVTTGRIGSDVAGNYQNGHSKRIRQWRQIRNLWQLVA